jgi:hypothetical protein
MEEVGAEVGVVPCSHRCFRACALFAAVRQLQAEIETRFLCFLFCSIELQKRSFMGKILTQNVAAFLQTYIKYLYRYWGT